MAVFLSFIALAQSTQIPKGQIVYEKSINVYSFFKNLDKPEAEQYKPGNANQFYRADYSLYYNDHQSLYVPQKRKESKDMNISILTMVGMDNHIFIDKETDKIIVQKKGVSGEVNYESEIDKIKWKLTDEEREIAGYKCRRANGIMLDSVYVVAFYSTDFDFQGGPESFSGLPGMILGVALPHENVTWFATKVNMDTDNIDITPPKRGKKITKAEFISEVDKMKKMLVPWAVKMLLL